MKNISITGHTRGIGKTTFDALEHLGYNVKGFSRSNGFDIGHDREKIIRLAADSEVFINNAHFYWCQIDLLYDLFERWKDSERRIINISSVPLVTNKVNKRAIQKIALDEACTQLQKLNTPCQVINLKLGYVDTPLIADVEAPKLTTKEVAEKIIWIIEETEGSGTYEQSS